MSDDMDNKNDVVEPISGSEEKLLEEKPLEANSLEGGEFDYLFDKSQRRNPFGLVGAYKISRSGEGEEGEEDAEQGTVIPPAPSAPTEYATADIDQAYSSQDASDQGHIINSVSSNSRAGSMAAAKRASLLYAQGEPQVGRREPAQYNPWPKRIMYIRGLALGAIVVVIVFVIMMVLGADVTI